MKGLLVAGFALLVMAMGTCSLMAPDANANDQLYTEVTSTATSTASCSGATAVNALYSTSLRSRIAQRRDFRRERLRSFFARRFAGSSCSGSLTATASASMSCSGY